MSVQPNKVNRWAMRQPLKKSPDKAISITKKNNDDSSNRSKYVHVSRARPKSAHPSSRSRSNTLDTQISLTMSSSSTNSSRQSTSRRHGIRPTSAPAYRGRKKESPFEKQLRLASKQANLMRLIMVESRRNKELTAKMSNTKAKLKKIRQSQ